MNLILGFEIGTSAPRGLKGQFREKGRSLK